MIHYSSVIVSPNWYQNDQLLCLISRLHMLRHNDTVFVPQLINSLREHSTSKISNFNKKWIFEVFMLKQFIYFKVYFSRVLLSLKYELQITETFTNICQLFATANKTFKWIYFSELMFKIILNSCKILRHYKMFRKMFEIFPRTSCGT